MTEPVELTARRDHRPPLAGIAILAAVIIGFLVYGRTPGWWQAALVVAVLAGGYGVFLWRQGRTVVTLGDGRIGVRSPFRAQEVAGADIVHVREISNGRSPNHRLVCADGRRLLVPTSEVRRGHAAVFAWLAAEAPRAELDTRSQRTRALLAERGQLSAG